MRSVNLYHPGPLERVRRVALDTSSRTSVALLKVLLRERLGRDPEYVAMAPSLAGHAGSGRRGAPDRRPGPLLRGRDAAARPRRGVAAGHRTALRLRLLGRAARRGRRRPGVAALQEALASGRGRPCARSRRATAARARAAPRRTSPTSANTSFTTSATAEQEGLREFYRRALALGLIPRVPELRFHGHALRRSGGRSSAGERLSREEGVALLRDGELPRARHAGRRRALAAPPRARGHLHHRPQHQLHERLHRAVRLLRLLPRPAVEGRLRALARPSSRQKIEETIALGGCADPAPGRPAPRPRDRVLRGALPLDQGDLPDDLDPRPVPGRGEAHREGLEALDTEEALRRLMAAGLDSIPGGGAEILSDRVRQHHRHRTRARPRTGSGSWRPRTASACGRRPP